MSTLDILLGTIAPVLENIIDNKISRAIDKISSPASMLGEYAGTDSQGKQWVIYDGSDIKSPISWSTIEAAPGDRISVTVQNGKAVMDKNLTNPSAGIKGVEKAELTAQQACEDASKAMMYSELASLSASAAQESADSALSAATDAKTGAANAWNHADSASLAAIDANEKATTATQSASQAQTSADAASTAANEAQESADNARDIASVAQISADIAQTSANTALLNLSEIENIVGAAEWIQEHGTYSNDLTEFDASAIYWVVSPSSPTGYAIIDDPSDAEMWSYAITTDSAINPDKTYYTQSVVYTYNLTRDTEIITGKAYYIYDSENDEYDLVVEPVPADLAIYYERTDTITYSPVANPDVSEISNYYERTSLYYVLNISDSVQNYIAAHLALADDGLHIYGSSIDYSALLGLDGLDIRKPGGISVAKYGENFRVGAIDGVYLQGTPTRLAFTSSAGDIVYFGLDEQQVWSMFMEQAYVRDMIRFGNYAWVKRANGNLTMKYLEE